jgi:hypothetical protein
LHSGEILRNVFQEAQNKFSSLKIISYPIVSDRLYRSKIFISAQKFGNLKTPDAQKDLGEFFSRMPKNMLGSCGILRTKKSYFCPKYLGPSWKNPDAQKKLGILRIFYFAQNFQTPYEG